MYVHRFILLQKITDNAKQTQKLPTDHVTLLSFEVTTAEMHKNKFTGYAKKRVKLNQFMKMYCSLKL